MHGLRNEEGNAPKKNDEVIFSLAWNIMFTDNQKVVVLNFLEIKNMVFLSQKVDGKMISSDYWKFFLLVFSRIGYTVIFWAIKLMERRYLLITEKLFVLNFSVMGIRSFLSQEVDGKMIFTVYWEVAVLNFSVMGNTVFFFSQNIDGKMIST